MRLILTPTNDIELVMGAVCTVWEAKDLQGRKCKVYVAAVLTDVKSLQDDLLNVMSEAGKEEGQNFGIVAEITSLEAVQGNGDLLPNPLEVCTPPFVPMEGKFDFRAWLKERVEQCRSQDNPTPGQCPDIPGDDSPPDVGEFPG